MTQRRGTEQATVNAILKFLALHHIPAWHMRTGAAKIGGRFIRFGAVGMADIIGVLPRYSMLRFRPLPVRQIEEGLFLAIEVKSATGAVTLAQKAFLQLVNAAGGKAFVARTVDDVARELGFPPSPTFGGRPISWATARRISRDGP